MRSIALSRRATTAAASSRSATPPWMPGSVLVRRSSASASASGALGLAARQLGLDPRRRRQRAEDDERAGGAPPSHGCDVGLERLAQRAHDDRVLLAHAQQHQVHRQLEGQVLEEEREVEALVELDRDEDRLHRERRRRRSGGRSSCDRARARAAARRRRGTRATPGRAGGSAPPISVSKKPWPRMSSAGCAEQQLGRLGPLGDRPLAVGEDEVAVDDLPQQRVERVDGPCAPPPAPRRPCWTAGWSGGSSTEAPGQ